MIRDPIKLPSLDMMHYDYLSMACINFILMDSKTVVKRDSNENNNNGNNDRVMRHECFGFQLAGFETFSQHLIVHLESLTKFSRQPTVSERSFCIAASISCHNPSTTLFTFSINPR